MLCLCGSELGNHCTGQQTGDHIAELGYIFGECFQILGQDM